MEYSVLRRYLRLAASPGKSVESRIACAMDEELTARQRQMVRMYYLEQKTMPDIARELGVGVSTVSRTIARGRRRLRRCLRYGGSALLSCAEERL